MDHFDQKLSQFTRLPWNPVVQEGDGALLSSKFSGLPWLAQDEQWPICVNCEQPMQLLLQLNISEMPE